MAYVTPMQTSFNGGEISPRMTGRIDQRVYAISLAEMVGFMPVLQGPAIAAPGTYYVADAAGPVRLIPFVPFVTQGYIVEASAGALRFYTNDARIETSPGVAYQLTAPWTYDQLKTLDYEQSSDVLYLVHNAVKPRQLSRLTATSFALAELDLKNGPFTDGNADESLLVSASGVSGAVTLTASAAIFAATDVGSLFRLEAKDYNTVPAWEPGIETAANIYRAWASRVYQTPDTGRTGTVPPIHGEGTEYDGMMAGEDINSKGPYGVRWTYVHDRFGIVRITGYTSPTQVSATVIRRLPGTTSFAATWRWAFGAFSETRGWPSAITIWNQRLVLAKDAELFGSVVGDYQNFASVNADGDVTKDQAFRARLPDPNRIVWLAADRSLLIGTENAEYLCGPASAGEAFGPGNISVQRQTTHGCAPVRPIEAYGRVLFVQNSLRKLRALDFDLQRDRYDAENLTRFADHLGIGGLGELAWQQEPEALLWSVRGTGELACMLYDPREQAVGWYRRPLGGGMLARSVAVIPDQDGSRDQLWVAAETASGWRVLRMARSWEIGDAQADAFFVDAGLSADETTPKSVFSGLDHLIGQTVDILADGKPHPRQVVDDAGRVTLTFPAQRVHVGLPFDAWIKTLPPEAGNDSGVAQGKVKRVSRVTLRLIEALGLSIDVQNGGAQAIEHRVPADAMNEAVPLFTGDYPIDVIGSYDRNGSITLRRTQPLPSTIAGLLYTMDSADA